VVDRNFYEIIRHDQPCSLYFDLEHFTYSVSDDSKIEAATLTISHEVEATWPHLPPASVTDVSITSGSRPAKGEFKHYFHVAYPRIRFCCNFGSMREVAQRLAGLSELQALEHKGGGRSLLDPKVYTREQNFRFTESCKFTTSDMMSKVALHPFPTVWHPLLHLFPTVWHSLQALLWTVITYDFEAIVEAIHSVVRVYALC